MRDPDKAIGTFTSSRWGCVHVSRSTYEQESWPCAVTLTTDSGEPLAALSVNMYLPECSHDSKELPTDCFYVKEWSENKAIAADAFKSGLFILRDDLPIAKSGFVAAPVWQIK